MPLPMFKITKESCFWGALILVAVSLCFKSLLFNSLSIWLLIFTWIISSPIKEKIQLVKSNKLIWLFSSLFLIYVIGLIYGDLSSGGFEIEKRLSLIIFPIVLGTSRKINSEKIKVILVSFAVSCTFISIICFIDTFYSNYSQGITYVYYNSWLFSSGNLTQNYGFHPSYFSIYSVFSIFIFLYFLLKSNNMGKLTKIILIVAIIYLTIFILFLAVRTGVFSLLTLSICIILFYPYKKHKLLYRITFSIFFIFIILCSIQFLAPIREKFKGLLNISSGDSRFSSALRFETGGSALEVIKEHLFFGIGTGNLQPALQKIYKRENFTEPYEYHYNPHNQFLDITATLGIVGLFIFLLCLFYPIYLSYKNKNYLYALFLILFIFISLPESTLAMHKGVVWYAFFNSLFAFHSFKH